ncbi:MAG: T9SS type A sorting domain-containing protein [Bacteroidales bacterium]|nr:T9SS type A sorting domain-containing protein [Bacteroidales bacterium]
MKKLLLLFFVTLIVLSNAQTTKNFVWDGTNREYIEYVPAIYDGTEAVPLVVCLHGLGDNMTNFSGIGMHTLANSENFIVLTPQALIAYYGTYEFGTAWNSGASYLGIVLNSSVDDLGFFNAMIDSTMALYNIDPNRIYFTGFSMGGFMCQRVAAEMNSRVAAIASVAGTIGNAMTAIPPASMPVLHCHGTADTQVPYEDNNYGNDAEELINYWVTFNNCDTEPIIDTLPNNVADGITVIKYLYDNGDYSTDVEFYKAVGADHQWLYPPTNDMSYTIAIWEFFSRHSKEPFVNTEDIKLIENGIIFPNPANDYLQINSGIYKKYEILSLEGKLIISGDINKNTDLDVSFLDNGCYFIKLTNDINSITEKIIISR